MQLRLEPVTQENRLAVLGLRAGTGQEGFVETVSACLDEAAQRADWRPMAIYDGTAVVGFAMYGYFWEYPPAGRVWLDRLLIGAAHYMRDDDEAECVVRATLDALNRFCGRLAVRD